MKDFKCRKCGKEIKLIDSPELKNYILKIKKDDIICGKCSREIKI